MSIATRIEAIEQHLTDDYSVLELAGADLTNVDKNIVNLKPTWKERLLYFINNGTDIVWNNWEKVVGEGTELTLSNTEQAPMKVLLKGNTYQDSTTGKNIITTNTITGQTSTFVNYILSEPLVVGQAYTISWSGGSLVYESGYSQADYTGSLFMESMGETGIGTSKKGSILTSNSITFTATIQATHIRIYKGANYADSSHFTSMSINNLMIEAGSTSTSYEPYTNGPSPNPDYPQEVHVVSGDNTIKVEGKNLYNVNDEITSKKRYTTIDSEGWITMQYDNTSGSTIVYTYYATYNLNLQTSTQYALMIEIKEMSGTFSMEFATTHRLSQNATNIFTRSSNLQLGISKYLITTKSSFDNATAGLRTVMNIASGDAGKIVFRMSVLKDTTTTVDNFTYEPYQSQSLPINLGTIELCKIGTYQDRFIRNKGKNIIDNTNLTYTYSNVSASENTLTTIDSGIRYTTLRASGSPFVLFNILNLNNYIGKTIRLKATFGSTGGIRLVKTNANATTREIIAHSTTSGETISYVVPSDLGDTQYLGYVLYHNNISSAGTINFTDLILTIDNEDMTYEPYGNGEWYKKAQVGKITFNGSENWGGTAFGDYYRTQVSVDDIISGLSANDIDLYSNYFYGNNGALNSELAQVGMMAHYRSNNAVYFMTDIQSYQEFKTWLSTHNTDLYYRLNTPTYTKIEGNLYNQLEEIKRSYEEQTNISQTNDDLPFELSVSALSKE